MAEEQDFQSIVSDPILTTPEIDYSPDNARRNIQEHTNLTNLINYEFSLDEGARDYESAVAAQAVQRSQLRKTFIDQMKARNVAMNAQLQAFGDNQQLIANQLLFNEEGALRAENDARTVLGDRLKATQFSLQELRQSQQEQDIQREAQRAELQIRDFAADQQAQFATDEAQAQQNLAIRSASLRREVEDSRADFQLKQRKDQAAYDMQQMQLQRSIQLGQAAARGRMGSTAVQTRQTINALAGIKVSQVEQKLLGFVTQETEERRLRGKAYDLSIDSAEEAYTSATDRATFQKKVAKGQNMVSKAQISMLEEVANNRIAMQSEQLGEQMISALSGFEQQKERIFLDKFKADAQAYASRMSDPQFADAPREPFQLPEIPYIPPPLPVKVPKGASMKPPERKTSIFGKILQIGGLALAAAAIPVSGGASIGLLGAGTITGATGAAGLTAAGGFLSQVGSSGWI